MVKNSKSSIKSLILIHMLLSILPASIGVTFLGFNFVENIDFATEVAFFLVGPIAFAGWLFMSFLGLSSVLNCLLTVMFRILLSLLFVYWEKKSMLILLPRVLNFLLSILGFVAGLFSIMLTQQ